MEEGITTYVSKCLMCLKIRNDHPKPSGLLVQPEIPHGKLGKHSHRFYHKTTKNNRQLRHDLGNRDHQEKNYADVRRKPLEFQIGDKTMLKVSPWKGVIRFSKREKLNPRYIKPFRILVKVGTAAYRLEPPEQLSRFHSTFHVSNLKVYLSGETFAIQFDEIQIDDTLHPIEEPVEIMNHEVKRLKRSRIPIVKVRWNSRRGPEYT
ncbi:hypothetical protein Tco_0895553 [Tanacetum coccineum]|uniref:Tf2-1-like SH3-like domain-containing protein n=1 Tax=Tanacetum coccineum TaxID=301880 RepID=A0ABQ5CEX5_9ASTR